MPSLTTTVDNLLFTIAELVHLDDSEKLYEFGVCYILLHSNLQKEGPKFIEQLTGSLHNRKEKGQAFTLIDRITDSFRSGRPIPRIAKDPIISKALSALRLATEYDKKNPKDILKDTYLASLFGGLLAAQADIAMKASVFYLLIADSESGRYVLPDELIKELILSNENSPYTTNHIDL